MTLSDRSGGTAQATATYATTTPTSKPLMGASTSSNTTWTTLESAIGTFQARRTYGSAIPASYSASQASSDYAAGRASYWSFKPNQTTFAADATAHNALRAFLRTVPVGHRFAIINYHEPEDNINAGSFTLSQWKACVQKSGEIVDEINAEKGTASRLRNGICLMGPWTFDSASVYSTWDWTFTPAQLASIHVFCIDPYRWKPAEPSLEQMLTRNDYGRGTGTDRATMTKALAWGKPVVLSEWGCTSTNVSDTDRAAWIRAAWAWMKSWNQAHPAVPIEAAPYFHNNLDVASNPQATWEVLASGQEQSKQALIDILADAKL